MAISEYEIAIFFVGSFLCFFVETDCDYNVWLSIKMFETLKYPKIFNEFIALSFNHSYL